VHQWRAEGSGRCTSINCSIKLLGELCEFISEGVREVANGSASALGGAARGVLRSSSGSDDVCIGGNGHGYLLGEPMEGIDNPGLSGGNGPNLVTTVCSGPWWGLCTRHPLHGVPRFFSLPPSCTWARTLIPGGAMGCLLKS
jgi:hypothetical protein